MDTTREIVTSNLFGTEAHNVYEYVSNSDATPMMNKMAGRILEQVIDQTIPEGYSLHGTFVYWDTAYPEASTEQWEKFIDGFRSFDVWGAVQERIYQYDDVEDVSYPDGVAQAVDAEVTELSVQPRVGAALSSTNRPGEHGEWFDVAIRIERYASKDQAMYGDAVWDREEHVAIKDMRSTGHTLTDQMHDLVGGSWRWDSDHTLVCTDPACHPDPDDTPWHPLGAKPLAFPSAEPASPTPIRQPWQLDPEDPGLHPKDDRSLTL